MSPLNLVVRVQQDPTYAGALGQRTADPMQRTLMYVVAQNGKRSSHPQMQRAK